jgi:hypothetical protein
VDGEAVAGRQRRHLVRADERRKRRARTGVNDSGPRYHQYVAALGSCLADRRGDAVDEGPRGSLGGGAPAHEPERALAARSFRRPHPHAALAGHDEVARLDGV